VIEAFDNIVTCSDIVVWYLIIWIYDGDIGSNKY
jgi:hypothetical protein